MNNARQLHTENNGKTIDGEEEEKETSDEENRVKEVCISSLSRQTMLICVPRFLFSIAKWFACRFDNVFGMALVSHRDVLPCDPASRSPLAVRSPRCTRAPCCRSTAALRNFRCEIAKKVKPNCSKSNVMHALNVQFAWVSCGSFWHTV